MKLDRNINPDGRGKYALIHLRKVTDEDFSEILYARRDRRRDPGNMEAGSFALDVDCLTLGDEKGEQFFVIKYKDEFAEPALRAYAAAVRHRADAMKAFGSGNPASLFEYAKQIEQEADIARSYYGKKLPD